MEIKVVKTLSENWILHVYFFNNWIFSFLSLFFIIVVVITVAFVKLGITDDGVSFGAQSSTDVSCKIFILKRT